MHMKQNQTIPQQVNHQTQVQECGKSIRKNKLQCRQHYGKIVKSIHSQRCLHASAQVHGAGTD
jgi:hypothetical protein